VWVKIEFSVGKIEGLKIEVSVGLIEIRGTTCLVWIDDDDDQ
jgi:hypothetical protein